ncbi:hypothetical protein GH714_021794 [Hevea brasiliensis]|uniref:Pre-mRNA-processing factor 19 n=1 Tax=Hevea brasiliensis TaxID=3981 RepID=A0A6A6MP79_HEVBR|nr:hypothetical protein GH714_021794 [Hevea brasiliensis]
MDDIVLVKTGKIVKPRTVQTASIPGMLGIFQNEWDALMLSNFALEQQLHTARQELSHALYQIGLLKVSLAYFADSMDFGLFYVYFGQHDAACRVITRLKKERDEARSLLAQAERQMPILATAAATTNVSAISNGKRALSQQRKKRQIPPTLAPVDALERYTQLSSHPLHKTSKPGIVSVDIHYSKAGVFLIENVVAITPDLWQLYSFTRSFRQDIIATGGVDSTAVLFDRRSGQILSTLSGHSKKVTSVKFVTDGDLFLTGSADKTVRVWQGSEDGNYDCRHILKDHTAEWKLQYHEKKKNICFPFEQDDWYDDLVLQVSDTSKSDTSKPEGYTSAAFHPDGLILGTGTSEAVVKIWDVKSQANVARFDGHVGAVTAISFSENGYFLATAAHDSVKLWDLRKLKNFRTLNLYD